MMIVRKRVVVHFKVLREHWMKLRKVAEREDVTISHVIRRALARELSRKEKAA